MARHSSVHSLGSSVVDEVLTKWRSGQYTIEQLQEIAGGKISWSALQRFLHRTDVIYRENRRLEDEAAVWCAKVSEDTAGDVGQLCRKMLRIAAHARIKQLNTESAEQIDLRDLATLARTLKDLEMADALGAGGENRRRGRNPGGPNARGGGAYGSPIDASMLARVKEMVRGPIGDAAVTGAADPAVVK